LPAAEQRAISRYGRRAAAIVHFYDNSVTLITPTAATAAKACWSEVSLYA